MTPEEADRLERLRQHQKASEKSQMVFGPVDHVKKEIAMSNDKPRHNQGDYPEDFHMENGNYWNKCCLCEEQFTGHKRRYVCKKCKEKSEAEWEAMSDEEKEKHMQNLKDRMGEIFK